MNHYWIKVLSVPLLALALVACPVDKITGIDATANPATIASGATSSLTATVSGTGAFNAGVNWSIVSGGGSLSSNMGASVTYTAPSVTSSTTVQIKAAAAGDSSVFKTLTFTVQPATSTPKPTINAFSATPASLTAAGQVTLVWDVSDATSLSVDSGVGAVTGTSKVVSVTSSTAFTLTATNANGSSTKTIEVTVASLPAPPTVVSVSPENGAKGVRADAKIVVTFSKAMDQSATQAAYQSADLPAVGVTFDWNAAGTEMTIKPNAPLEYAKETDVVVMAKNYEFKLTSTAKDKGGLALTPLTSSFKTLRQVTTILSGEAARGGYVQSDGYVSKPGELMYVGDNERNLGIRGFLSFDLSVLPAGVGSGLLSATLKLQKYSDSTVQFKVGSPYSLANNPARLDQVDLDHVVYGSSLDGGDYNTNSIALLGAIDSFDQRFAKQTQADVLSAVLDDLTHSADRENRSQYRVSLFKQTNNDSAYDYIVYGSASAAPKPSLILEYLTP
jgi:Bacterial Ig-like domain